MKYFLDHFFESYQSVIFFYCCAVYSIYTMLGIFSFLAIKVNLRRGRIRENLVMIQSTLSPGISIITAAFNEEMTIIPNVRCLLNMNYPLFEVVIVNDGSTDKTLEKLIEEFSLIEVAFAYHYFIPCTEVQQIYKSQNPACSNLLVINKRNGGCKADAINAGINVSSYPYFLNTDVDCILANDTLISLIQPFVDDDKRVIATGATLRMVNNCIVDAGVLVHAKVPKQLLPIFQEIEYIRSFILGKMGWNLINGIPNVSGGLGMFDREIAVKAGGYDPTSFGEDMDMLMRMSKYMLDTKQEYAVRYIPQSLCWTEGPSTLKVFKRQRVRWGRGLYQIFSTYYKLMFNPKFKMLGLVVLPYNFLFEFCAPMIECLGIICYIYLIVSHLINWPFALVLLLFVYSFSIFITLVAIVLDQLIMRQYSIRGVLKLCAFAFIEPFIYHPMVMIFALIGYTNQFFKVKSTWGHMERKGFAQQ